MENQHQQPPLGSSGASSQDHRIHPYHHQTADKDEWVNPELKPHFPRQSTSPWSNHRPQHPGMPILSTSAIDPNLINPGHDICLYPFAYACSGGSDLYARGDSPIKQTQQRINFILKNLFRDIHQSNDIASSKGNGSGAPFRFGGGGDNLQKESTTDASSTLPPLYGNHHPQQDATTGWMAIKEFYTSCISFEENVGSPFQHDDKFNRHRDAKKHAGNRHNRMMADQNGGGGGDPKMADVQSYRMTFERLIKVTIDNENYSVEKTMAYFNALDIMCPLRIDFHMNPLDTTQGIILIARDGLSTSRSKLTSMEHRREIHNRLFEMHKEGLWKARSDETIEQYTSSVIAIERALSQVWPSSEEETQDVERVFWDMKFKNRYQMSYREVSDLLLRGGNSRDDTDDTDAHKKGDKSSIPPPPPSMAHGRHSNSFDLDLYFYYYRNAVYGTTGSDPPPPFPRNSFSSTTNSKKNENTPPFNRGENLHPNESTGGGDTANANENHGGDGEEEERDAGDFPRTTMPFVRNVPKVWVYNYEYINNLGKVLSSFSVDEIRAYFAHCLFYSTFETVVINGVASRNVDGHPYVFRKLQDSRNPLPWTGIMRFQHRERPYLEAREYIKDSERIAQHCFSLTLEYLPSLVDTVFQRENQVTPQTLAYLQDLAVKLRSFLAAELDDAGRVDEAEKVRSILVLIGPPQDYASFPRYSFFSNGHALQLNSEQYLNNILNIRRYHRATSLELMCTFCNPSFWRRQSIRGGGDDDHPHPHPPHPHRHHPHRGSYQQQPPPPHSGDQPYATSNSMQQQSDSFPKKIDRLTIAYMDTPMFHSNPVYNYQLNSVLIPSGVLAWPFYMENRDHYDCLATIVPVIAHELAHSLDRRGAQFDLNGSFQGTTNPDVEYELPDDMQCFSNLFTDETLLGNLNNGHRTLNENIADHIGLHCALGLLKMSNEYRRDPSGALRRFFIANAQLWCDYQDRFQERDHTQFSSHSVNQFRVDKHFLQSWEFLDSFHCSDAYDMTHVDRNKCTLINNWM